jgi:hypothetical protein
MKPRKLPAVQPVLRKGEGTRITTVRDVTVNSDGTRVQSVTLDLSSAVVPDRRYSADVGWVEISEDMVRIFFGQRKVGSEGLESVIVVRVSFQGICHFLAAMDPLAAQLSEIRQRLFGSTSPAPDTPATPNHTVVLDANIIGAGFSGRSGCLDFYYASPYVMESMQHGGDCYADGVVRVTLSTQLLVKVLDVLLARRASIPTDENGVLP